MSLGEQLGNLSDGILELILESDDIDAKKKLREQLNKVLGLTGKLVDANVDKATNKYQQATNDLNKANDAIRDALNDLEKVADTITKIAKAIDKITELAAQIPEFYPG